MSYNEVFRLNRNSAIMRRKTGQILTFSLFINASSMMSSMMCITMALVSDMTAGFQRENLLLPLAVDERK